ncbi:phytanoyl-CoA dioxygenase family protein [Paenibacillus xerothermodurans]|uniref:Phytanoyl-CoA dioxygenase family protein n=1 Tax=Paenibacillus xerothermodurans TaxID=1977292 RepID=A0A2W1NDP0_PAEXE|nr:phytanoyl-CoA dioxygenase family protein [Paenibacillus xerothermodurans]PZE22829.1 phytanoyl-CoA dioxygenase family protein [Paenibacillus xerothermodurans]
MEPQKLPGKRTLISYENAEEQQLAKAVADTLYRYDHFPEVRAAKLNEVTDEHVRLFWQQGYLVVDEVLNAEEVRTAIAAVMDAVHGKTAGVKVQFVKSEARLKTDDERELAVRKIYDFIQHDARLNAVAHHQGTLDLIARLFAGEKAVVVQDQALLKPPSGGAEKPWHQDMAYGALAYDRSVIGMWTALDPAGLDNGCMHVIPYSHRQGAVPHYAERDWQLCDSSVDVERDVAVPLKPGGALFFSGLLHHGTPPNFSDKRRRALQIHYAPESARKLTPQEYKRMFTNELTNAEC